MSDITIDVTEIRRLASLLDRAADTAPEDARDELQDVAQQVLTDGISNAQGMALTGELASSVRLSMEGDSARIYSNVRQAFFLEYGSPNTGGPRPWLSEPAERGSTELLKRMSKIGDPLK